jgi:glyoxylase-like metal-dependent hydrolase (beta-lactamase superfamily II)
MVLLIRKRIVLIDTAIESGPAEYLYPYLKQIGVRKEDISMIINTHTHADHIEGNAIVKGDTGAELGVHENGAEKLRNPRLFADEIRKSFAEYVPFIPVEAKLTPMAPDFELRDGDIVDLGDSRLEINHTPGHDTDAICILDTASGYLFTGDSIQCEGTASAGIAFYLNLSDYRQSLKKIEDAVHAGSIKAVVAAHPYIPYSGIMRGDDMHGFLRKSNVALRRYDEIIRDLLIGKKEPINLLEITTGVLRQVGLTTSPALPVLAMHTVSNHINEIRGIET